MGEHGVTIGDFLLIQTAMDQHLLAAPFPLAIGTGMAITWSGLLIRHGKIISTSLPVFYRKNTMLYT